MNSTKNDLSFDKTKLDFNAMLRTAAIAYSKSRFEIERELSGLQNMLGDEDYLSAGFPHSAERLATAATQMAIAADTYHTLMSAVTRNELEVVNKPPVKEVA